MSEPIDRDEVIRKTVEQYKLDVIKKNELIFETIKMNSGKGEKAIDLAEACQWVDATQNVLCTLFQMLKAIDTTGNNLAKDFIMKVRANLECIANE